MTLSTTDLHLGLRAEADLSKISGRLRDICDARFDVVAPQAALHFKGDAFVLDLGEPQLTEDGVTEPTILAGYTRTAWRQLAERLSIPLQYLDRLMAMEHRIGPALAVNNLNDLCSVDARQALYRFVRTEGERYVLRAVLSDRYRPIDNDTALQAIVAGLGEHGLGLGDCEVTGDVTPDRLRLRIAVAAPSLLGDYRMPYSLRPGNPMHARPDADETPPVLFAGIEITNSETGLGAFQIRPRIVVAVCRNGLTRDVQLRRAHIGAQLEQGSIDWSTETQRRALELVASQVRDAVATYLSPEYVHNCVEEMRRAKTTEVESAPRAIEVVQQRFGLSEGERDAVFELFAAGGDRSVLGLGNAVTAAAQLATDGDRQSELETRFWAIVEQPGAFVGRELVGA